MVAVPIIDPGAGPVRLAVVAGGRGPQDARRPRPLDHRREAARAVAGGDVEEGQRGGDDVHPLADGVADGLVEIDVGGNLDQIELGRWGHVVDDLGAGRAVGRGGVHFGVGLAVNEVLDDDRGRQLAAELGGVALEAAVDDGDAHPLAAQAGGVPGVGLGAGYAFREGIGLGQLRVVGRAQIGHPVAIGHSRQLCRRQPDL